LSASEGTTDPALAAAVAVDVACPRKPIIVV
jgi:hypothetical protein